MKSTLAKKLSQYSAVAGIITLAKNVDAQIIYTDINPDFMGSHTVAYGLDLNNDGTIDLTLSQYWSYFQTGGEISCGGWLNEISSSTILHAIDNSPNCIMGEDSVKVLSSNALISANQAWNGGGIMREHFYSLFERLGACNTSSSTFHVSANNQENWSGVTNKFMGIRVLKDSHYYYGWIRLSVDAHTFTVKDYAINLTPDSAIYAGQVDCGNLPSSISIPNGQSLSCNGNISITANVQLSIADSFQWFQDGQFIANSDSSAFNATTSGDYYYVVDYNNWCYDTSEVVSLLIENFAQPVITASNDTLFSNYATGNQWFFNSYLIFGATENFYVANLNGGYQVEVSDSVGCFDISNAYYFIATGIQNNTEPTIAYFLNEKILHINLGEEIPEPQTAKLVNELGVIMQTMQIESPEFSIDMNKYSSGIYFLMIDDGKRRSIIKFVLN